MPLSLLRLKEKQMIRAGIVGGTGYTGVELLRILALHEEVEVAVVTSRADAGSRVDAVYPGLRGYVEATFSVPDVAILAERYGDGDGRPFAGKGG
jgi:N-acetyl-gamma-glutamyl-phosphate reductase